MQKMPRKKLHNSQLSDLAITRRWLRYLRHNKIPYSYANGLFTLRHCFGRVINRRLEFIYQPALSGLSPRVVLRLGWAGAHLTYCRHLCNLRRIRACFPASVALYSVEPYGT